MTGLFGLWISITLGLQAAVAQPAARLTDEQARDVAAAAIRPTYPQPCYKTSRNEGLEDLVLSLRVNRLAGNQLNAAVFFYRVTNDSCSYVVEEAGKPVMMQQVSFDCCDYGIVAVDRDSHKSYWFSGEKKADIFREFARDEQVHPDSPKPYGFLSLYRSLVWGESGGGEIESLNQLREIVQRNFQSAWSPYERDAAWESKFQRWWSRFRSATPGLKLETTSEPASGGDTVRGYSFQGYELRVPRADPPPKGTPALWQWTVLVKSDGSVERLPSRVVFGTR
jgi:hypothetical protein